ncbi:MAG: ParB/RepB/Spo0J family partition protein [Clostridium sp.]|nr:ParB/RepB/Spo0J family partition protein [Clostridium sp.]
MKANGPKRKIFDAVDMMTADTPQAETGNGLQSLPVDKIEPFHEHPFRLYEGERLNDMVESVREHGVLNPVIVRKKGRGYEMLSGHNRLNAAKIAGLSEIPAIVKEELTEEEAYVYVIETNMIQRAFSELLPSEKAAVLAARYEKVISQGKRNDILREIEEIGTCGHDVHKSRSRDGIGEEYGMTGRNIARYMRVDKLIPEFKEKLDDGEMTLTAAVELSYLSEEEQGIAAAANSRINESTAKAIRAATGELTAEKMEEIMHPAKRPLPVRSVSVKIPAEAGEKYFSGMKATERTELVMKALDAWFAGKEAAHVSQ